MFVTYGPDRQAEAAASKELYNSVDQFAIVLIDNGAIGVYNGDDWFVIPPHSFIFISPRETVKIENSGGSLEVIYFSPRFLNLNYTFEEIERIRNKTTQAEYEGELCFKTNVFFDRNKYPHGVVRLQYNKYTAIRKLYHSITHNLSDQPDAYWSCRARSALGHILTIISGMTDEFRGDQRMDAVIDYIQCNYSHKITEEQITNVSGLVMQEINHRMIDVYGVTFADYLADMRMDLACMSLAYTALPMSEIASNCGYYDQSHLAKVIKKHKGMSPLQYRKHAVESRKAFYRDKRRST